MAAITRFFVNYNLKRCICTSANKCAKNYANRQAKFLNKLMGSGSGKRKWFTSKERTTTNPMVTEKLISNHVNRRTAVLNKLFMQHITDLMSSGEASTELIGRKIEVTHVKVTPDFQRVLVFWGSKLPGSEEQTAKILNDCGYRIRHELSQLRVIGQVPIIQFVKNRQLHGLAELEKRMNAADYGEDFEPTTLQVVNKPELTLTANFSPEVREKILKLEDLVEDEEDDDSKYDVELAPMRHDVLGLDHSAIMNRVTISLKKAQEGAQNRLLNVTTIYPSPISYSLDLGDFQSSKAESQAFTDFLIKRQMEEKRKLRRENKEGVLEYNLRKHQIVEDEDNDFEDYEKDDDIFEDISLESLK